jgi:nucleoid-associated protein YgaU
MGRGRRAAALAVAVLITAGAGGFLLADSVAGLRAGVALAGSAPVTGPALLQVTGAACGTLAGAVLLWLGLGALVAIAEHLATASGVRRGWLTWAARRCTPAISRRLVAAALGLSAAVGVAPAASAAVTPVVAAAVDIDPGWAATPSVTATPEASAPAPASTTAGWRPERPAEPVRAVDADLGALAVQARSRAVAEDAVVVRRGDTLWDVAARHLPAGATDAQIAVEWPRWYAANRDVVGPDPHLIRPGMRLVAPAALSAGSGS